MAGDWLLVNGKVRVAHPRGVVASALLIRGGRVAVVGDEAEVRSAAGGAPALDLQGATVLPGFIDAHCHLLWHGESLVRWVDLRGATSLAEIQGRLRARLAERPPAPGDWLLGGAFDQDLLEGKRMPTAADLDVVSTEIPVVIQRVCAHALVASTRAQELAGVQAPEGYLAEGDTAPIWAALPPLSFAQKVEAAERACLEAVSAGFTGAHCIVSSAEEIEAFRELDQRGDLPIHLRLMVTDPDLLDPPGSGLGRETGPSEGVPCRTLKLFTDGSLGAHTAALTEPYADMPETSGRLIWEAADLRERVARAHRGGYQVAVHAIGDAAVAMAVDAIAAAQAEVPRADARHRIEHASVLPPHLVRRLAALGILAVVQPQFVVSDFWTGARLGPARAGWAYPFRSMLECGVRMAGGTDCPVEALDPFQAIGRAMRRGNVEERLGVAEAVGLFTSGSAFAGFQEGERGALYPGCSADLLVLPEDPWQLSGEEVERLRPELSLVGGRVRHAAGRFAGMVTP